MTFAEAEKKVARLAIEENCYILMTRGLEEKSAELKELAKFYRERANQLHTKQFSIWNSVDEETDSTAETDSMSALGLSLEEAD